MTMRATAGLSAGALLLAGLLAGCGGDDDGGDSGDSKDFADQSYDDIKKAGIDAMGDLKAVHVDASISSEGSEAVLDLSMSEDGSCTGEVGFGEAGAEVLQTADGAWFKPNEGLLAQQFGDQAQAVIAFIGDKWVADTEGQVVPSNCDLADFIEQVTSDEEDESDTEVAGTEDVDGAEAVKLTFSNDDGDGTAYILADEPHYIAKFEVEGDEPGTVTFSEFDEDVEAEAPDDDDVVDLADFQG
jgi:hypothetical protein